MQLPHKSDFMKQMSKHIAETLNKPETYVCVTVHDDVTMVWGGEEQPCALGTLKSIGGINLENNKKLMQHLCETLERDFMIPKNRVYVEFVDMERVNCGFDGATFGG
jgi:phenylpyruvate tautomerase|tara:strand:+ start:972 stop:1292 length:321 start_codon:yes stop_codon:yes gene_type:complete